MQLFTEAWTHEVCTECNGSKTIEVQRSGKCPDCKGQGHEQTKTTASVLHDTLRPGQLLLATYDPLMLMKKQNQFKAVDAAWRRIERLHDEDVIAEGDYTYYPDPQEQFDFGPRISVDLETPFGGDPRSDDIYMGSITNAAGRSVVFKPDDPRFLAALESAELIVGQNYTLFDARWLYHHYGTRPKAIFDTRFAGHLLNPDTPNDLTTLCVEYATPSMEGYWKSANNYKNKLESVCALDTDGAWRVADGQTNIMHEEGVWNLFHDQVIPLSRIVLDMYIAGQRINVPRMRELKIDYEARVARMREADLPYSGTENSKNELRALLYDEWRLPQVNKREGERNTRKDTLTTLAEQLRLRKINALNWEYKAETIEKILSMRKMSKLASTFLSYQFEKGHEFSHPTLNPAGTGTLRLSSSNPNAQQIPPDTRPLFIPDADGRQLTSVDIRQAEVVSFLWLAEEWEIYDQVLAGADIHQLVADLCNITRYEAKTTTFALLFGEEPETTAVRLGITVSDVLDIRKAYFEAMPGVQRFRNNAVRFCRDNGYVITPWNTRRHIRLEDWQYKGHAINQVMNTPIQATPAIAMRQAMVNAASALPGDARLWMQVHDELIVEHDPSDQERVVQVLREAVLDSTRSNLVVGNPYGSVSKPPALTYGLDFATGIHWGEL
jgi:DNA polymerase-1